MPRRWPLMGLAATTLALWAGGAAGALASGGGNGGGHGDANAGDVWVDTAGAAPGPGHEMDSHLPCADVWLWGDRLADPSGAFRVLAWPPTGGRQVVFSGTWSYSAGGGVERIATIPISALQPGGHFKLDLSQDPAKHKVFWVSCASPSKAATPAAGGVAENGKGGGSPRGRGRTRAASARSTGLAPTAAASPASAVAPQSGVLGASITGGGGAGAGTMPFTGQPAAIALLGVALILGGLGALRLTHRPRLTRRGQI